MGYQEMDATAAGQQQGKTFTQEQVNAIVSKRLAEQKAAMEADLVKKGQDLNKREMAIRARELLEERGLPKELSDVMRYDTEEELVKAIGTIEHTRGFRKEEPAEDKGVPKGFRILENRLPSGSHELPDPIAEAFGVDAPASTGREGE